MKELIKTPFITAMLTQAVGQDTDLNKLHVFEVRATNTSPLKQFGGLFQKARISAPTIYELAKTVNEAPVALMMDHNTNGPPFGKFFYGEAVPTNTGQMELRGLIYVDDSDPKILSKLEASSIDEVSIQFLAEKVQCSECGFDYFEAAAADNFAPLSNLTCDQGHVIGKNGVHTILSGVKDLVELSLVSRGAATNSKIIGSSDAMWSESAQRLAASGVDVNNNYYCRASINSDEGENKVDSNTKELADKVIALADDKIDLSTKLSAADLQVAALTAERDAAVARAEAAEAKLAVTPENSGEGDTGPTAEVVTEMAALINEQYIALKALEGDLNAAAPEKVEDALKFIASHKAKLSAALPVGGVAVNAPANSAAPQENPGVETILKAQAASFKSTN